MWNARTEPKRDERASATETVTATWRPTTGADGTVADLRELAR
jgi:hypothetical protein